MEVMSLFLILKELIVKKARAKTMNKVILMGRLTKDPEVRYSQGSNSTAVASTHWRLTANSNVTANRMQILLTASHLERMASLQRSICIRG